MSVPRVLLFSILLAGLPTGGRVQAQDTLYASPAFTVTGSQVRQGGYVAEAVAGDVVRSTYVFDRAREPRPLTFKFAINGFDNEAPPGRDHGAWLYPVEEGLEVPTVRFGSFEPLGSPPDVRGPALDRYAVTFRVDLAPVLQAFDENGVYVPEYGRSVRAEDFEGVYIAGNADPLSWDFRPREDRRLVDPDGDGVYEITLIVDAAADRPFDDDGFAVWRRVRPQGNFPRYKGPFPLVNALADLALDELLLDVRDDGAFMAGEKWTGVWTRDVSYSILLSLALIDPEGSKRSLLAKTQDGVIVQDTGTGGSWPVSTDRMVWALAAWEIYTATGDSTWLRTAYETIRRSAEADLHAARDPQTGLFRGESSFLDWREQTYPSWMDPRDIYASVNLGTNVVHFATYEILGRMARLLGERGDRWERVADEVRDGIRVWLWQARAGYPGQYRYGRNHAALSDRAEALGSALAVVTGLTTPVEATRLVERFPMVPYGVPSVWPQTPGIPPYHNDGVWPFVTGYWAWAGAEAGNAAVTEHALASIYRAAGLFLTNKENMVATTGLADGTEINSDRQLWSVAANLATVYRVLIGVRMEASRLVFRPFVPEPYGGVHRLEGLKWRGAVVDVTIEGFGSGIRGVELDGRPVAEAVLPGDLKGGHRLSIVLDGRIPTSIANVVPVAYAPEAPRVSRHEGRVAWSRVASAAAYEVLRNGTPNAVTEDTSFVLPSPSTALAEWQVRAIGRNGLWSYLSEPVAVVADGAVEFAQPEGVLERANPGFTADGYVRTTTDSNGYVEFELDIPADGTYAIDARYANGNGPINTDNRAAIRTVRIDETEAGVLVMPQRGTDVWEWGYTNAVRVRLGAGTHRLALVLTSLDANMNRFVNEALVDHVRATRLDR